MESKKNDHICKDCGEVFCDHENVICQNCDAELCCNCYHICPECDQYFCADCFSLHLEKAHGLLNQEE